MPRVAELRVPAEALSPEQRARHLRILRAAARIGAEKGLDGVQMVQVARGAGVAIGTLYRYFPSKTHLFTAVMAEQVERLRAAGPRRPPPADREQAVADLLVLAGRQFLRRPRLAAAMLASANAANVSMVEDLGRIDAAFREVVLATLGVRTPTATDVSLVRLLIQCWYGALASSLNGRVSIRDSEADIRTACRLLLAPCSAAADPAERSGAGDTR